jgi:hypothetical protein
MEGKDWWEEGRGIEKVVVVNMIKVHTMQA